MVSEKGIVHIGESTDVGRNWIDALLVGKKKILIQVSRLCFSPTSCREHLLMKYNSRLWIPDAY